MIEAAKAYAKLFSSRIVYRDKIIAEYSELENRKHDSKFFVIYS